MDFKGVHQTFFSPSTPEKPAHHDFVLEPVADATADQTIRGRVKAKYIHFLTYLEENKQQIFYLCVFYVAIFGTWIERFSCESFFSTLQRFFPLFLIVGLFFLIQFTCFSTRQAICAK